jgi:hypothetical protein
MSWCPHCKTEYIPGVDRCADCGALLVDTLPPEPAENSTEPVWLTAVTTNDEIALLTGLLDSADIPYYGLDRGTGGYLRIVMGRSIFEQDIYVAADRYDEARTLLQAYRSRHPVMVFEDDEDLTPEPDPGPGAYGFYVAVVAGFFLLFLYALIAGYL